MQIDGAEKTCKRSAEEGIFSILQPAATLNIDERKEMTHGAVQDASYDKIKIRQ